MQSFIEQLHSNDGRRQGNNVYPTSETTSETAVCTDDRDPQATEHRTGLRQIGRLSEHVMIQLNDCIAPQHDRLRLLPCNRLRFALCEGLHLLDHGPIRHLPLLKRWALDVEWNTQQGEQLATSRRG